AQIANTHTGTASTNVGIYGRATGGSNANIGVLASGDAGNNSSPLQSTVTGGTDSSIYSALTLENSDSNSAGVDGIGVSIKFNTETETNGTSAEFGRIATMAFDASNSSKDGEMRFYTQYGNALTESMRMNRWGPALPSGGNYQLNAY